MSYAKQFYIVTYTSLTFSFKPNIRNALIEMKDAYVSVFVYVICTSYLYMLDWYLIVVVNEWLYPINNILNAAPRQQKRPNKPKWNVRIVLAE